MSSSTKIKRFAFVSVNEPSDKVVELLWKHDTKLTHINISKRNRILTEKDREFFSDFDGVITGNVSFALQLIPSHVIGWIEYAKDKETSEKIPVKFHRYDYTKGLRDFETDDFK